MKHLLIITFLISVLTAPDSIAQMGHGMMRGHGSGQGMMEHMQHEGMMSNEKMMGNMTDMMNRMSGMMGNMSGMMKDMPKDKMKGMSGMMRDMSKEMMEMSEMMDKGTATDEEIKAAHERIMELQKRMSDIGK